MKKISKITVKRIADDSPDTSWLGEYSNKPNSEYSIDRKERGDQGSREYQYFNLPFENYKGIPKKEILKYCEQDYERIESFNKGNWYFLGIKVEAEIQTSKNGKEWLINRISSGGLFGIESDSESSYFEEIEKEQINELKIQLLELGFSGKEIAEASKNIERKES